MEEELTQSVDPKHLQAITDKVRNTYYENRKRYTGITSKLNNEQQRCAKHWERIALLCLKLDADPEVFVGAAFKHFGNAKTLLPNMLYGTKAKEAYEIENNVDLVEVIRSICNQIQHVAQKRNTDIKTIILQPYYNFSPVVCYALFPDDPNVINKYAKETYETLKERPDLVKILDSDKFPSFSFNKLIQQVERTND